LETQVNLEHEIRQDDGIVDRFLKYKELMADSDKADEIIDILLAS